MTVSQLIRWYYQNRDGGGAPGMDFVDSTGRIYAEVCRGCGWRTRHTNAMKGYVLANFGDNWH